MAKSLLLADDSVTFHKVVELALTGEDVTVTPTKSVDEALAKARELRPDLILADTVMPGKTGYDLCATVKSDPNLSHIPVLLLVSPSEPFDEGRGKAAGMDSSIPKPFQAQALIDQVRNLLTNRPAVTQPARGVAAPLVSTTPSMAPAPRPVAPSPRQTTLPPGTRQPTMPPGTASIPPRQTTLPPGARPAPPAAPQTTSPSLSAVAKPQAPAAPPRPAALVPPPPPRPAAIVPPAPAAKPAAPPALRPPAPPAAAAPRPVAPAVAAARPSAPPPPAVRPAAPAPAARPPAPAAAAPRPAPTAPAGVVAARPAAPLAAKPGVVPPRPVASPAPGPVAAGKAAPAPNGVPKPAAPAARPVDHEALLREALSKATREMIEKVVWEVVPELAETMIKEELAKVLKARGTL